MKLPDLFKTEISKAIREGQSFKLPSVELLDVTLRDGGFGVNFNWEEDFIAEFTNAAVKSGLQKVEIGYLGGVSSKTGWYEGFAADIPPDFIQDLSNRNPDLQIVAIINPWRLKRQIIFKDYKDCGLKLLRVAFNPTHSSACWQIIEKSLNEGIQTCLNITSIAKFDEKSLEKIITESISKGVKNISFADTTSSLTPTKIESLSTIFKAAIEAQISLGFHGHDILGLGNANAFGLLDHGITTIDVSVSGIGRGGKNLVAETWLFMKLFNIVNTNTIDNVPALSHLISKKLGLPFIDIVGLTCAILGISPEIVEGYNSRDSEIQLLINQECVDIIKSIM